MEREARHGLIKRLQREVPRGAPLDLSTLSTVGISQQAASQYVKRGWLLRLGQGVYAFPGDDWTAHGALKLLQRRVQGLHVGGKSALSLHGVRHNLASRERLTLWGDARFTVPEWFSSRFPARYVSASLFEWPEGELRSQTLTTPPSVTPGLRVSTPERAAREMLYDVGNAETLEESRNVFEGLRNLRVEVTGRLLSCCTSVKAVRLFLTWSRETGLLDVDAIYDRFTPRVGSDRRWIGRLADGTLLTLKSRG